MTAERNLPNILITGTPGCGKTTLSDLVSITCNLKHIDVSKLVKENRLHDGYDEKFDTYILNEDKLCDELEIQLEEGGCVLDFHSCDFFPERWFDLIVVLRCDNSVLYPRLENRGYSQLKINENIQCEIMQVVLDEARESYSSEIIVELLSNTVADMEENVERISEWIEQYKSMNN